MAMDFVDEFGHMIGRRELRNAVTEIENMSGMVAEAVEHRARLAANGGRRREQHGRIEVALQRDTCPDCLPCAVFASAATASVADASGRTWAAGPMSCVSESDASNPPPASTSVG